MTSLGIAPCRSGSPRQARFRGDSGAAMVEAALVSPIFILIVFGVGVVAQVVLSKGTAGSFLAINITWGLAVMMGCYVSAGVTGAHLNPAVTLALAVRRRFPWHKVLPYATAQTAGAFAASAVVYLTYREALAAFDLRAATAALWEVVAEANRFVSATRPWELAKAARAGDRRAADRLGGVLAALSSACRVLARELLPFLPAAARRIESALDELDPQQGRNLFPKVEATT